MATSSTTSTSIRTVPGTPVLGPRLHLLRLIWVLVVVVVIGLFLASVPLRSQELHTVVAADQQRQPGQLSTVDLAALSHLGITIDGYVYWVMGWEFVFNLIYLIGGVLCFIRKSTEWMPIYISLAMVTFAVSAQYNLTILALETPIWNFAVNALFCVSFASVGLVFLIFPDGIFTPAWL